MELWICVRHWQLGKGTHREMCILNRNMKLIPESVRVQGKHSKYIRYNELELGVLELLLP